MGGLGGTVGNFLGNNLNTFAAPIDAITGANAANMLGLGNTGSNNTGLFGELSGASSPATQTNYDGGMPTMPGYVSETTGPAYNDMKAAATNPGASPWASAATAQQTGLMNNAVNNAQATSAGQTAQANDALAAQGGLSSGARERVAETGAKNDVGATQAAENQNTNNDLQINQNDAQNKMQQLGTVTGLEAQNQKDLNSYTQNAYNTQMSTWAANNMANATANSGKGGSGGGK